MESSSTPANTSKWSVIKRKVRKVVYILITFIVVLGSIFMYWKYFYTYSEGYRAGLLQKFSHKGNFFKTYEGELILNNVTSSANVVFASEKFYFSVTSRKLAKQLDTIQGKMVILHYLQKNGSLSWHGDSEYIVDSVKRIQP